MRKICFFLAPAAILRVVTLTFTAATLAATAAAADPRLTAVDEIFSEWNRPDSPGCALAVVHDEEEALVRGYGSADLETGKAIAPETIFRLGEASQPFTAAAVELAIDAGQISFGDDVRKFIPGLPRYQAPVTVRHLLAQESGLPDYRKLIAATSQSATPISDELALRTLAGQRFLGFDPGQGRWKTSPSNYFLLAHILEQATSQSLRDFAAQHLFQPRGMTRTRFHDPYRIAGEDHAVSYARSENGSGFQPLDGGREILGPGGVETSASDLVVWLRTQPPFPEDAFRFSPAGSHGGFRAAIVRRPAAALDVACLCNQAEIDALALAEAVADLYLEPAP